jgi:hypothetical protein
MAGGGTAPQHVPPPTLSPQGDEAGHRADSVVRPTPSAPRQATASPLVRSGLLPLPRIANPPGDLQTAPTYGATHGQHCGASVNPVGEAARGQGRAPSGGSAAPRAGAGSPRGSRASGWTPANTWAGTRTWATHGKLAGSGTTDLRRRCSILSLIHPRARERGGAIAPLMRCPGVPGERGGVLSGGRAVPLPAASSTSTRRGRAVLRRDRGDQCPVRGPTLFRRSPDVPTVLARADTPGDRVSPACRSPRRRPSRTGRASLRPGSRGRTHAGCRAPGRRCGRPAAALPCPGDGRRRR